MRADDAEKVQKQSSGEFPLAQGGWSFVLFRPSSDWIRPSLVMEDNLLRIH